MFPPPRTLVVAAHAGSAFLSQHGPRTCTGVSILLPFASNTGESSSKMEEKDFCSRNRWHTYCARSHQHTTEGLRRGVLYHPRSLRSSNCGNVSLSSFVFSPFILPSLFIYPCQPSIYVPFFICMLCSRNMSRLHLCQCSYLMFVRSLTLLVMCLPSISSFFRHI